ncbi:MAG: DUF86 domain-containing protein [Chloroflexota bacterium]
MVRMEVIRKRLNALDEYLSILEKLGKYDRQTFLDRPEYYGSTERFLQLAIETLTDIGGHVIADLNLGSVDHYNDIPQILAEKGYLSSDQAETWIRMIGFRNILVHDYLDVDRSIVYDILQNRLKDLHSLKQVFIRFL